MNAIADQALPEAVRRATGCAAADLREVRSETIVDDPENMTTAALRRYRGHAADGSPWSVVAKTLRPASRSPLFELVPEEFRPNVLRNLDWHSEPRLYSAGLESHLPDGLRPPKIYWIDRSEDAITIWMEDVPDSPSWDADRYRRAAVALGAMAGRCPEARIPLELGLARRNLHDLFFGKITHLDLRILSAEEFWQSPPIRDLPDGRLRLDLFELADRMPDLLDFAEALPHAMAHGDAAPANLLEPGDGRIVAIDWSYGSSAPVGSDLSQLLAGRYDTAEASPDELKTLIPTILEGFNEGLATEGSEVDRAAVEAAFAIHLGVRTVFSLLIARPGWSNLDSAVVNSLIATRAALARAGLDFCRARGFI